MKKSQEALLTKHRELFRLLIEISNQVMRQDDLTELLLAFNYCKNKVAVTRLLKDLEDEKLIKRGKLTTSKTKIIQATKPSIRFISGDKANTVKTTSNGEIRQLRNSCRIQLFKSLYGAKNDLKMAFESYDLDVFNTFQPSTKFYEVILKNKLFRDSFDKRYSTIFKQKRIILEFEQFQREHIERTARTREKVAEMTEFKARAWTLDNLKRRNITLIGAKLRRCYDDYVPTQYSNLDQAYQLDFSFLYLTYATEPKARDVVDNLFHTYKFIKKSFRFHYPFFVKKQQIRAAIVKININVDVTTINPRSLAHLDQSKILKMLEKKMNRQCGQDTYKYDIKINFKCLDVNTQNEHIAL